MKGQMASQTKTGRFDFRQKDIYRDRPYCHIVWSDSRRGFGSDIGFIDHFTTRFGTTSNYSAIANLHTLQTIIAPAKSFLACCVLTSRSLATASTVEILQIPRSSPFWMAAPFQLSSNYPLTNCRWLFSSDSSTELTWLPQLSSL
jgi:hypothetical protein